MAVKIITCDTLHAALIAKLERMTRKEKEQLQELLGIKEVKEITEIHVKDFAFNKTTKELKLTQTTGGETFIADLGSLDKQIISGKYNKAMSQFELTLRNTEEPVIIPYVEPEFILPDDNYITGGQYNETEQQLELFVKGVHQPVTIPLRMSDMFLESGRYDEENKRFELKVRGQPQPIFIYYAQKEVDLSHITPTEVVNFVNDEDNKRYTVTKKDGSKIHIPHPPKVTAPSEPAVKSNILDIILDKDNNRYVVSKADGTQLIIPIAQNNPIEELEPTTHTNPEEYVQGSVSASVSALMLLTGK